MTEHEKVLGVDAKKILRIIYGVFKKVPVVMDVMEVMLVVWRIHGS